MVIGNFKAMVVCSKKWEKDGKKFNTVEVSILGLGSMSWFVDERYIPDLIEGNMINIELELGLNNGKPYLKPRWETLTV